MSVEAFDVFSPEMYRAYYADGANGGLKLFLRDAWKILEPHTTLVPGWHIDCICDHLEAVTAGDIRRLVIQMPPRHMKSSIVSVIWPVWSWTVDPSKCFLTASYAAELATRDAVKSRRVIRSPWFQAIWGELFALSDDQDRKTRYDNDQGGHRIATAVGATATGEGGDIVSVDDPHNIVDVISDSSRRETITWWNESMSTRGNDPRTVAHVITGQRSHTGDLIGHVIAQGGYHVLTLPAEYEPRAMVVGGLYPHDDCPTYADPRKEPGALLWPDRFGQTEIDELKLRLGPYGTAAQLQQRPTPAGGAIFKREWLSLRYGTLPQAAQGVAQSATWAMAWDAAYKLVTRDAGSYVAGAVGCRVGSNYYIARVVRGRWGLDDTEREIRALVAAFPKATAKIIEDAAFGRPVAERLEKDGISGIRLVKPEGGKAARAHAVVPIFAALNVYFPDGEAWVGDTVEELARFLGVPGEENDRVDAIVHLIRYLSEYGMDAEFGKALPQAITFLRGLHGGR